MARATVASSWQASMARGAPIRLQPKTNMKSGVHAICRTSEVVDQFTGTRTLPSPLSTPSNMPPRKVIVAPPKSTRAKSVALASTAPLAPMRRKSAGIETCATSPKPMPIATLRSSACPATAHASSRRPAPSARATADDAPAPMPPAMVVRARRETGNTRETAPIASTPRRLTKCV